MRLSYRIVFFVLMLALVQACGPAHSQHGSMMAKNDTIEASAILDALNQGKHVYLIDTEIKGMLDLTALADTIPVGPGRKQATVSGSLQLLKCTLPDGIRCWRVGTEGSVGVRFTQPVVIQECLIKGTIGFRHAIFEQQAIFTKTEFADVADFSSCHFSDKTTAFDDTRFRKELRFQASHFSAGCNFKSARMEDISSFQSCVFYGNAFFGAMNMTGYADFGRIQCYGSFLLNTSIFYGKAVLSTAHFAGPVEWNSVKFMGETDARRIHFGTRPRWENTTFEASLDMSGTRFSGGLPLAKGLSLKKEQVVLTDCVYLKSQSFQVSDLLTE